MTAPAIVFVLCIIIAVVFLFTAIVEALGTQFIVNTIVIVVSICVVFWFVVLKR